MSVTGAVIGGLGLVVKVAGVFKKKKEPSRLEKYVDRKKYEMAERNKVSDAIANDDSDLADVKRKEQQEQIDKLKR